MYTTCILCLYFHTHTVTISGTNLFGYADNITSVLLGNIQAAIDYTQANNTSVVVRAMALNNVVATRLPVTIVADTFALVMSYGAIWTYLVPGSVDTVSPGEGQEGTRIVIDGTNLLGGGTSVERIFLDGVPGNVFENATMTRIVVAVRNIGERVASFFPGQVYIMSDTGSIVFGGTYTHRPSGQITSFFPQRGRRGTRITLSGINLLGFGNTVNRVLVAGTPGTVESFDNTSATISAGNSTTGTQGPIQLIINTGAVITSTTNFTYDPPGVISRVVPRMGAEGTGLLIQGTALTPSTSQVVNITIGGIPVSRIVTATDSEISVIVGPAPAMNPTSAAIVIAADDGSIVDGESFAFINLTISLPGQDRGQEGTYIDIQLPYEPAANTTNFEPSLNMRVTIDDQEAQVTGVNATLRQITVRAPRARRQGTFEVDVAVESANRLVARLRNGFTYLPEGTIFNIDPSFGQLGTRVVIQGANLLGGGVRIDMASIAGVPANVIASNNETVQLTIMQNLLSATYPQLGDIILTADTGATIRRLNGFTLVQPGEITSVSPGIGQIGTRVTINGRNLLQGTSFGNISSVFLAGIPATILSIASATQIVVQASSATAGTPGQIEVILISGARIISPSSITFQYLQAGRVTAVNPNIGPVGTNVIISGTNFLGGGSNISQVFLGGVEATITSSSNTQINVTAAEGMAGSREVIIVSNTGTITNGSGLWNYEDIGFITQVSPAIGQQGVVVNITGMALLSTSSSQIVECRIAGIVATRIMISSRNEVACAAGRNPNSEMPLTGPVMLTTNTGVVIRSITNITNFTYYSAAINRISPLSGNNGTLVTITGTNLYGYPGSIGDIQRITFGSVEAMVLSRTLSTIQVRVGAFDSVTIGDTVTVLSTSGAVLELPNAWNYTQPRTISEVLPNSGRPGEVAYLFGQSLNLEAATSVSVIVGSVTSHNAQVINSSTIQFTLGVYQGVANPGENLPVQVVYSTGESILNSSVTFIYNATEGMVTSVSPQAGSGQAIVEINGTNLLNSQSLGRVTLAGIAATIVNATEERIILEAGAPLNEESSGPVVIQRADGTLVGLAGSLWTYYPTIMPSSVSPRTGQLGTFVEINLSQLNTIPTIDRVSLAGVSAGVISLNSTSRILQVRAGPSSQTTLGEITIDFNDNSVLRIPNSWSYQPPVEINSITPGLQGYFNTSIVLEGRHFQAGSVTVAFVTLAGVQTTVESQSNTQIRVRIAELRNTSSGPIIGPIVIISSEGATSISSNNFTYIQVNIDRVDPQMGQRGTRVTVTGLGVLLGATNISTFWLGNVEATVLGFNDSSITVSAAAFPMQTNLSDVTYIMNTGAVITIPNSWRYIVPGQILSVTPTEGNMGTLVTITGNNLFGGGSQAEIVILNSVPAIEIVVNFESLIQVLAGPSTTMLAPGNVQVIADTGAVTESAGTSVEFTYLEPGRITAFSPDEGQNGTRVEVRGMYLHSGERIRRVLLAGVEAEIVSISEDDEVSGIPATINLIARRPSSLESFSGPVTIESNHNTTTVSTMLFTYLTEGLILAVSPVVGQNGTIVTITGQDLSGGGTTVQQVFLAGVAANIISRNHTTVVVGAGESAIGRTGDVVLVSNTNAYVRRIDGWTYAEQGNVASVSPPVGQFGTRVTISGQGLLLGANSVLSVSFDNISAFDVISSSNTSITIRVGQPTSSSAFVTNTVIIQSDLGGVLYQNLPWNFTESSRILNVNPSSGRSRTEVTVSGVNLLGGGTTIMSVTVAGIAATIIQFNSNNVTFRTGLNTQGSNLPPGIIVLESDTGARTESSSQWRYIDDCPLGTFGTTGNCRPCNIECAHCFGPTDFQCYTCHNFSLFHPNLNETQCVPMCANVSTVNRECRDACELNQYLRVDSTENELFCYNCSELCDPNRQCSGPGPTECGACRFFYNTLNGSCVEKCPIGTYSNESNNCLPCDRQCTPESGCYGPSAAECFNCTNVRVSATLIDDSSSGSHDICLERCPSLYYLDASTQSCFPCANTCAMNCTGPSPFECMACLNNSFVYSNGSRKCVAECNPNSTMQLFYDDMNNVCQRCNDHCSRTGGCTGPTALDCNECATPMLSDGECVISCNNTHYHDTATNRCVPCHPSCTIGCTGTTVQDCIVPQSTAFDAGGGTIAIVIIIIIALTVIITLLSAFLLWSYKKHGKYTVTDHSPPQSGHIELGDQYAPACENIPGKDHKKAEENLGIANTGFNESTEVYSEMGPEEGEPEVTKIDEAPDLYTDMSSGDLKKSEGETGSQDLLYTDMSPAPIDLEEKETTVAPVVPERPPKPGEKPKEGKPLPPDPHIYKVPITRKEDKKPEDHLAVEKPHLECPPTPEMYTDMRGGIQEIHLNSDTGLSQDLYDDVQASTPQSPKMKQEDQAPLLIPTVDVLYEDTDTASESAQQYLAQSGQSMIDQVPHLQPRQPAEENPSFRPQRTSLGAPLPPPRGAADEVPPALPVRPVPKKRSSATPLPQTPLQQSLSSSNVAGSSTSPTAVTPSIDNIYEETAVPMEEILYEPIPAREQSHLISEPPPQQTKTKDGKDGKQKGGKQKGGKKK